MKKIQKEIEVDMNYLLDLMKRGELTSGQQKTLSVILKKILDKFVFKKD